jgi:hypothetical protein
MSELLFLLIGLVVGAGGLFVWAKYNKTKAIALINGDLQELWKFIDDEILGDLDEEIAAKLKELFDKIFGRTS